MRRQLSKICLECKDGFKTTRKWQNFCKDECRKVYHNNRILRGLNLLDEIDAGTVRIVREGDDS